VPRRLQNWIDAYLDYSGHSESPEVFHFWTAVSVIAGALRRRVWINQAYFDWTPNHYIIFVAPPGIVSKSTTANIGMRLLRQIDDVVFGPDSMTWQALTESLSQSTREVLIGQDFYSMSCVTIVSSEFGTFLDPSDRAMVDVLVSLWDGQVGTWERRTKTQGADLIVNPWLNIIACTTPKWIAGNFPEYMIGGGFTSRCVFVYGEEKRHLVAYPAMNIPKNFASREADLVHDLEIISQLAGPVTMTQEAVEWGTQWYTDHYASTKSMPLEESKWGGYWARKQTHIHKLAMVLSAAEDDSLIIQRHHLADAAAIVTQLEGNLPRIFELVGQSSDARIAEAVREVVSSNFAIDKAALFRRLSKTYSPREVEDALTSSIRAGLIGVRQMSNRVLLMDLEKELYNVAAQSQYAGVNPSATSE
jgi:hypothetical protein